MLSAEQVARIADRVRAEPVDDIVPMAVHPDEYRRARRSALVGARARSLAFAAAMGGLVVALVVVVFRSETSEDTRSPRSADIPSAAAFNSDASTPEESATMPARSGYTYLGRCSSDTWQDSKFSALPRCDKPPDGVKIAVGAQTAGVKVRAEPTRDSKSIATLRPRTQVTLLEVFSTPAVDGGPAFVWGHVVW